jgi:hypothetical protein
LSVLHSDFARQTLEHLGSTGVVEAHAALGLQILRRIGQFAWTEYWLYTSVAER